jgi:ribose-phosphate pyrophosphokinase
MLHINLVNLESASLFKVSSFPDGQHSFELLTRPLETEALIISRMNSFEDVEIIICANRALRNAGVEKVNLYTPYFLGARSDRRFSPLGINYVKEVIAPIINAQNFNKVYILDPHSDVIEACINNFVKVDSKHFIKAALIQIDNKLGAQERVHLISPDAGALKKVFDIASFFKISNIATASKVRNINTGQIVRTELPTMNLDGIEHFVIIDDICDGGRTFIELAKEIKKQTNKPVYLIVTHGIFSAGFTELEKYFTKVFTTNSICDFSEATNGTFLYQTDINSLPLS